MEEWKDIQGYEGLYQVSNYGRVKSLEREIIRSNGKPQIIRERILRGLNNSKDHYHVRLQKNKEYEQPYIHRLVAKAFIPNPNNYTVVHHINEDPTDNRVENLEWIDFGEHTKLHNDKTVYQYTLDGKYVATWSSAIEAERILGYNQVCISRCCNGGYYYNGKWINFKSANGYKWSYKPL